TLMHVSPEPLEKPGAGVGPAEVGRPWRDAKKLGRLLDTHAGEEAELDQLRRLGIGLRELREGLVDRNQIVGTLWSRQLVEVEWDANPTLSAPRSSLAAGVLDQDAAHRLGRRREEMPPALPSGVLFPDQSQVSVVDQGSRLEGLPGGLAGQLLSREL